MPVRIPAAQRAPRRGRLRYKPFTFQPSRYLVRTWWLASGELLNFSLAEFHSDLNTGGPEGTPAWTPTLQTFYLPALAIFGADVVVGFRRVAEFQFGGVPLQRGLRKSRGQRAEQHGFGQRTCVVEAGGSLAVAHHRFHKLVIVVHGLVARHRKVLELVFG